MNGRTLTLMTLLVLAIAVSTGWAQTVVVARPLGVQVLFDRTHEAPVSSYQVEGVLTGLGFDVVRCDASLTSVADELAKSKALLIWQEVAPVPFTPDETKLITDYVRKGGTLILVGNLSNWKAHNRSAPANAYPLFSLAGKLGVKLAEVDHQQDVEKGKVFYYHRRDPLSYTNLVKEARTPTGKASQLFLSALPAPQPGHRGQKRTIDPEKELVLGRLRIMYPENLASRIRPLPVLLKRILPALEKLYDAELEADVTVRALAFNGSQWIASHDFDLNVCLPTDRVAFDLTKELAYCWYFPGGRKVTLPRWIAYGWTDATAARVLKSSGLGGYANGALRTYKTEFLKADPTRNQLDLSVKPASGRMNAYRGKAIHLLEALEKRTRMSVPARLRKGIRVGHGAGWFQQTVDGDQTVQVLSLALGVDCFDFFKQMGVTVTPKPLDFEAYRKLEAELDKLLAVK